MHRVAVTGGDAGVLVIIHAEEIQLLGEKFHVATFTKRNVGPLPVPRHHVRRVLATKQRAQVGETGSVPALRLWCSA